MKTGPSCPRSLLEVTSLATAAATGSLPCNGGNFIFTRLIVAKIERRRSCYFVGVFHGREKKPRYIKIGLATRGKEERRINQLRTGSVHRLELLFTLEGAAWERKFHRKFSRYRVRGEFYKAAPPLMKMLKDLQEIRRLVSIVEGATDSSSLFKRRHNRLGPPSLKTTRYGGYGVRGAK